MEKENKKPLSFKRVLGPFAIVLMIAIVAMTFTNAVLRYTVGKNVLSFEEYSRFCFVWICYIGTVIAFEEKRHICVDLLSSHLKGITKTVVTALNQTLVLAASSVVLRAGLVYLRRAVTNKSAATQTNMGVVVVGLPLMAACIIFIQLMDMYKMYIKKNKEGNEA